MTSAVQTLKDILPALDDEDANVRSEAIQSLGRLDPRVLEKYTEDIIRVLKDKDSWRQGLGFLDALKRSVLANYTEDIIRVLKDKDSWMQGLGFLGKLGPRVLAKYAGCIIPMLHDTDLLVRSKAFRVLGNLEPSARAKYADDIRHLLADPDSNTRTNAVRALGNLLPREFAKYADGIRHLLADPDSGVRTNAVRALGNLLPRAFAKYADDISHLLVDTDSGVRSDAVGALGRLGPKVLAKYTEDIFRVLKDKDTCRWQKLKFLMQLPSSALEEYVDFITSLLHDTDLMVRSGAIKLLGNLQPPTLAKYAYDIIQYLLDSVDSKLFAYRHVAFEALGRLGPRVLADYTKDIISVLKEDVSWMLCQARIFLDTLEPHELAKYVDGIIPMVRKNEDAIRLLGRLDPPELAKYADCIIPMVRKRKYVDTKTRTYAIRALGRLDPRDLAKYADYIGKLLANADRRVRADAIIVLGRLEPRDLAKFAEDIVLALDHEDCLLVRMYAVRALGKLDFIAIDKLTMHLRPIILGLNDDDEFDLACNLLGKLEQRVLMVALVPHRHAMRCSGVTVTDEFRSLRGRVWLARLRQLFWGQRLLWWWGSLACKPGSRQAMAAASEFARMQRVSVEEEGEREVKRARVV